MGILLHNNFYIKIIGKYKLKNIPNNLININTNLFEKIINKEETYCGLKKNIFLIIDTKEIIKTILFDIVRFCKKK